MFCADNSILIQYEAGIKVNPLRCNRWTCEPCREGRQRKLRKEAFRGHPNTFITLTVNPDIGVSPSHRAKQLKKAFKRMLRVAARSNPNGHVPFLAVFEETENGEPHLHVLARSKWIDQGWMSEFMEAAIGAPVVDIRRITSKKAASRYVSKYIGKNPEKFEGCKRYWRSLDYLVEPRKEYTDPIGERKGQWFERGLTMDIVKTYTRKFYRLETVWNGRETEFWLVDDFCLEETRRPPPLSERRTSGGRPPQEPALVGSERGLFE